VPFKLPPRDDAFGNFYEMVICKTVSIYFIKARRGLHYPTTLTKEPSTRFSPAVSNMMVSLLPS
jgi:hypothetical protein